VADKTIEAILGSPPEHEGLTVQLFVKDGDEWGQIYQENGVYLLEVACGIPGNTAKLPIEEVIRVLGLSLAELRSRNEGS
jgi:hypothetical protein